MRRVGEIIDEIDLNGKNQELITELVGLSTKHGIITPYTSFLADETSTLRDLANVDGIRARTEFELGRLSIVEGKQGVSQRSGKRMLQEALAPASDAFGFGVEGGLGGMGGGLNRAQSSSSQPAPGGAFYLDADTDKAVAVNSVQTIGNETLYKRGKVWIAESAKSIDLERDSSQIENVERFSDAYFKLVAANTPAENTILARQQAGEELVIKFRGKYYRIR
jgi:Ca-activated chloride channel family protein